MKDHIYNLHNVVIGCGLDALFYAHKNNFNIIINNVANVAPYDTVGTKAPLGVDKSFLKIDHINFLKHELSMRGYLKFGPLVDLVQISGDRHIDIFSRGFKKQKATFNKIYIFDGTNIAGCPFDIPHAKANRVLDWFICDQKIHKPVCLDVDDMFVRKIISFSVEREKFVVVESLVNEENLNSDDASHLFSRLKCANHLRRLWETDDSPHLSFKKREVIPINDSIYIEHNSVVYKAENNMEEQQ